MTAEVGGAHSGLEPRREGALTPHRRARYRSTPIWRNRCSFPPSPPAPRSPPQQPSHSSASRPPPQSPPTTCSAQTQWSAGAADPALDTAGVDSRYALILGDVDASTHFVIDTSRNGQGPWDASASGHSVPEDWCNPPDRGLGLRPTADTGNALVDAYLWIKVPAESDGQCLRGAAGPEDPERGMIDPAAGEWFVEMADELLEHAAPAFTP